MFEHNNFFVDIPEKKGNGKSMKKFAKKNEKAKEEHKLLVEEIRKEVRYNGFFV